MRGQRISLVIASYNQTNALALVLAGVGAQERLPDEILLADDGSEPDTKALIESWAPSVPVPVVFTTQEDLGFRKARALNNALRKCSGDFVLFLDGDCIPTRRWVTTFVEALQGRFDFATAGYVMMDLPRSRAVTVEQVSRGAIESQVTDTERAAFAAVHRKETLYRFLRMRKKPRILGGNWAARRTALLAVNGFDECFDGFGKEDSDIRNRLVNAGFRGISLWDRNWVFHCSHDLDPRRTLPGVWRKPPDLSYYQSRRHATRCELGIADERSGRAGAACS